jgi:hypothetical protein
VIEKGGDFYIVEDFAHRLPELSTNEVEDQISSEFAKLRRGSGASQLKRADVSYLRKDACDMARANTVDVHVSAPGAKFVITFTMTEPDKLPADVTRFRSDDRFTSYGVSACFERSQTYPNGVYWVVMVLFPKSPRGD